MFNSIINSSFKIIVGKKIKISIVFKDTNLSL